MASEVERARHALEKGKLLEVLREAYGQAPMLTATIARVMDRLGFPMSGTGLQFALQYLADKGYARIVRAREVPGYRHDRLKEGDSPETIVLAALMPLGLQLIDGNVPEDPQVAF